MKNKLKIAEAVKEQILKMQPGEIFKYSDLDLPEPKFEALAASLSRMVKKGFIKRFKKGYYYIPKKTAFGELKPSQNEVIKNFTYNKNTPIGYESGLSLFNSLGLTTQMPNQVTIVTSQPRSYKKVGNTNYKFIKSKINFKKKDIILLQLLDALKNINLIPDSNVDDIIKNIKTHLTNLSSRELIKILTLANNYNPSTRALVGAIVSDVNANRQYINNANETNDMKDNSQNIQQKLNSEIIRIKSTLNPMSSYKIPVNESILPNKYNWKIT